MPELRFPRTVNEFFWLLSSEHTKFYEVVILSLSNASVLLGVQTVGVFFIITLFYYC